MKKLISGFLIAAMFCTPVFAQVPKQADPNRVTVFNKVTDSIATIGQSAAEKQDTLNDRKEERRLARLNALERKKRAQTRRQIKRQQEIIQNKLDGQGTAIGL